MKKLLALLLAAVMVLSLAACGGSGTETPTAAPAGTTAAADATTAAAITLPIRCVQQYVGGGNFVWIVEANQAKARKIATGKTFGNRIVVAEGLKGGEKVIVDGWQKVGEGTAVAIR